MHRRLGLTAAVGLTLLVGACAGTPPQLTGKAVSAGPGEGFTNSELRVALYQWSTDHEQVKNVCLKNSLVIFAFLQECGSPAKGGDAGGELTFQGCTRRDAGRNASFLVHPMGHQPRDITVGFDEAAQQFTLATNPTVTKKY